ncbi:unnamed protein product [Prunus armeniaca]|uniref:Protein kinase domain-containing protein n=1 Tax=Prunus armeniaca TaxID=36596 RepID=A0A6J5WUJ6_PRUAR|nr:unnamed protein product [Prunus armeniaca]
MEQVFGYFGMVLKLIGLVGMDRENFLALFPETAANDYIATYNDTFIRFMLEITGQIKFYVWGKGFTQWTLIGCDQLSDTYATCGAFSICNQQNASLCGCLPGFEPKVPKVWKLKDHSNGCLRKTPLQCNDVRNSTFLVMHDVLHPVNSESLTVENIENCLIWKGDLLNVKYYHLKSEGDSQKEHWRQLMILSVVKYRDLRRATKNFSEKLGEGAFGSVFKGVLPDSTAIAVKELRSLNQGEKQFRNEVRTIGSIHTLTLSSLGILCRSFKKNFSL